jgi:hypothetical protein
MPDSSVMFELTQRGPAEPTMTTITEVVFFTDVVVTGTTVERAFMIVKRILLGVDRAEVATPEGAIRARVCGLVRARIPEQIASQTSFAKIFKSSEDRCFIVESISIPVVSHQELPDLRLFPRTDLSGAYPSNRPW